MKTDADVEAPTSPTASSDQLDRSLARGVAWTAGVKWLSQLLTWPATLIVIRLLSPEDYGLVAMGSVYVSFVLLVNEFGLGSAIIQQRDLTEDQIAQIYGLSILFGLACFLLSMLVAYPLAVFYRIPTVRLIVMALSINFFITSARTVPIALLTRDFQFRLAALNEAIGAILQSCCLVLFAWLGYRHWALVIGFLIASLTTSVLACVQRPHRVAWPRLREIRGAVAYGSHLVGSRVAWYLYTDADFFIIGRVLGTTATGSYGFAWSFASLPLEKVTSLVGRVAPPILSAVQNDLPAMRRYITKLSSGIALLTLPAGIGLGLVARDFVLVAAGPKWIAVTEPLRYLALFATFRSLVPILSQAGNAVGLVKFVMRMSILAAIVMPISFLIGTRWGTTGVAVAWLVAYPVAAAPLIITVLRRIGMGAGEYLVALWPAVSATLVMAVAVALVRQVIGVETSVYLRLAEQVATGAAAYAATIFLFHRSEVRSLVAVFRGSAVTA